MDGEKSPAREQYHVQGHNAIQRLEGQGVASIQSALSDLTNLIRRVEEGPIPEEVTSPEDSRPELGPPPLTVYLQGHSEEIAKLSQGLTDLSIRITEGVAHLKQLLY